ncbi:MAG: hypothetical protein E6J83_07450, partial [Deltaproteobacteria bacterium]
MRAVRPRALGAPSAPPAVILDAGHARKATLRLEPCGGRASLIRLRRLDVGGALAASGMRDRRIQQVALEAIPFAPGDRALDRQGRERLVQVLRVLASHPDLALSVRG